MKDMLHYSFTVSSFIANLQMSGKGKQKQKRRVRKRFEDKELHLYTIFTHDCKYVPHFFKVDIQFLPVRF